MREMLQKLFAERVSLRRYKKAAPITDADMDYIIQSTLRAPSGGNMMKYSIIKITDADLKKALSQSCDNQPFIATAPCLLLFCADFQRWYDYYRVSQVPEACASRGVTMRFPEEGEFISAVIDTMIAATYANVAAEAIGVGSCWIGDVLEHYEYHKELLHLPKWVLPVSMLVLGYYPDNYRRQIKPRFDQKFIVSENTYQPLSDADICELFAEHEKGFKTDNKFNADNFGQFNYFRKTGAEYSNERTRSVRVMLESWKNPGW